VVLFGTAQQGTVSCALGTLPLAADMPEGDVDVLIRPEQIRLFPAGAAGELQARVTSQIYYGHDASVGLQVVHPGQPPLSITARMSGHIAPRAGELVTLRVEGQVVAYPRNSATQKA
jgi:iron(III) transport system ATP-binding protein